MSAPSSSQPHRSKSRKTVIVILLIALILVVAAALVLSNILLPSNGGGGQTTTLPNGTVEYIYPMSNIASSISAKVGQTFIVQLSSNGGSTGYDWNVSTSSGIHFLNFTLVSSSNEPGAPVVRNYFFEVVQPGSQTITLQDRRQFTPYDVAWTINLKVTTS